MFVKIINLTIILILIIPSLVNFSWAENAEEKLAYIALIIDDLGYQPTNDKRAIMLPGQICYAFLPDTPHAKRLAELAYQRSKEIILHLPMESEQGRAQEKNVLTQAMDKRTFIKIVEDGIAAVPHISGINNHMGSLLSQSNQHMSWLMSFLVYRDLFFIDSRTTSKTIAQEVANDYRIPNSRRNIFLDHVHTREGLEQQYQRMLQLAKKHNGVVVIAHPFKLTLEFLEEKLPQLEKLGIRLVSVKKLIAMQQKG